jgi:hypothetical protein
VFQGHDEIGSRSVLALPFRLRLKTARMDSSDQRGTAPPDGSSRQRMRRDL